MSARILIVDDEATIRSSLEESLTAEGYEIQVAESGEEALAKCHGTQFDLLITDLRMKGVTGLEVLQALRNQGAQTPVIMMTAYGDVDNAVNAMRLGAYDFIPKPFKLSTMKKQVRAAVRATAEHQVDAAEGEEAPPTAQKATQTARTAAKTGDGDGRYMRMINACPGLAKVARVLEKVGQSRSGNDTSVLIQGESGSGKEIIARAIHEVSLGAGDRFMEINCAAVPETLLESELFGYEKGAFTDAKARKEGLFELAGGGTIFLDEIGEMGVLLQSRLLRVLEGRHFRRVGGKDDLEVKARIVAATNRKISEAIESGTFRNDLYYRLQVVEIEVPPLRERPQDLEILINAFLREFNTSAGPDHRTGERDCPGSAAEVPLAGQRPGAEEPAQADRHFGGARPAGIVPLPGAHPGRTQSSFVVAPAGPRPGHRPDAVGGGGAAADPLHPGDDREQQVQGGADSRHQPADAAREAADLREPEGRTGQAEGRRSRGLTADRRSRIARRFSRAAWTFFPSPNLTAPCQQSGHDAGDPPGQTYAAANVGVAGSGFRMLPTYIRYLVSRMFKVVCGIAEPEPVAGPPGPGVGAGRPRYGHGLCGGGRKRPNLPFTGRNDHVQKNDFFVS